MRHNCEKHCFSWFASFCRWIFTLLFLSGTVLIAYIIYNRYPPLFDRILKLWPIAVLILSVLLQYLYFETNFGGFLLFAGFFFIVGILFNINLYQGFYTEALCLPMIFLSLAGASLNYYVFKRKNVFLLPFVLIFIILSILLLLAPLYAQCITSSSLYLYLILIIIVSTFALLKNNFK